MSDQPMDDLDMYIAQYDEAEREELAAASLAIGHCIAPCCCIMRGKGGA